MSVEAPEIIPIPEPREESIAAAARRKLSSPWASGLVILITILWTIPTFGLLVTSLRPKDQAQSSGWWTAFTDPVFTLTNYAEVLTGGATIPGGITPYFFNSFAIALPAAIFPLVIATMAAYALAWIPFKGATTIFFFIFALQVIPLQMSLLPLLQMFNLGWSIGPIPIFPDLNQAGSNQSIFYGTYVPLWIAHTMFALPLAIFLLHNFVRQLPRELFEAARVDGASHFLIFRKLVLPLTVPAIASFAIFQFLWVWNDLLVALTFAGGTPDVAPITAYLANIKGTYGAQLHLITAGAFIAIVVPLIVFFSLQRFFVRGLLAGSVKG
ncbi:MAG: carbohydrate ABC transporter permease [Candidatus Nanopelagicales bacterium]|nr:carbohydrate ABC transporter permease [Candidatus Nanopelagicales bacterium]MCF8558307.1 carbohydrate ABC transporter permease [Candidatus Nanopelagicales bacterium]